MGRKMLPRKWFRLTTKYKDQNAWYDSLILQRHRVLKLRHRVTRGYTRIAMVLENDYRIVLKVQHSTGQARLATSQLRPVRDGPPEEKGEDQEKARQEFMKRYILTGEGAPKPGEKAFEEQRKLGTDLQD